MFYYAKIEILLFNAIIYLTIIAIRSNTPFIAWYKHKEINGSLIDSRGYSNMNILKVMTG